MKKALKVIAGLVAFLVVAALVAFFVLVKNLPSTWQIKQAVSPRSAQQPAFATPPTETDAATQLPEKKGNEPAPARTDEQRADEGKELSLKVLHEDFLNDRQPVSSVCAHLDRAKDSHLLRHDESANSKEFMKKLTASEPDKDPLVEAGAPVLRYTLRLSQVRDLIEKIDKAQSENSNELFEKASFYSQVALAANQIRTNKPQIDQILMKSYNMYALSQAVAKRPELARDPSTLAFCEQIEKNINTNMEFNADQQSEEVLKFLEYAKVSPSEIGYDPQYRSDVKFEFSKNNLVMNNIWLEKLFADDIKKAKEHVAVPKE